jgi:hypothetical protein
MQIRHARWRLHFDANHSGHDSVGIAMHGVLLSEQGLAVVLIN